MRRRWQFESGAGLFPAQEMAGRVQCQAASRAGVTSRGPETSRNIYSHVLVREKRMQCLDGGTARACLTGIEGDVGVDVANILSLMSAWPGKILWGLDRGGQTLCLTWQVGHSPGVPTRTCQ
jgi:hypothetical protein